MVFLTAIANMFLLLTAFVWLPALFYYYFVTGVYTDTNYPGITPRKILLGKASLIDFITD